MAQPGREGEEQKLCSAPAGTGKQKAIGGRKGRRGGGGVRGISSYSLRLKRKTVKGLMHQLSS